MSQAERIINTFRELGYVFELTSTVASRKDDKYSAIFTSISTERRGLNDLCWDSVAHGATFEEVVKEAAKKLIPDLTPDELCAIL